MKKNKQSVVLTGNKRPAIAARLEWKERSEVVKVLRQRLTSRDHTKDRTIDAFFREFYAKKNINHGLDG